MGFNFFSGVKGTIGALTGAAKDARELVELKHRAADAHRSLFESVVKMALHLGIQQSQILGSIEGHNGIRIRLDAKCHYGAFVVELPDNRWVVKLEGGFEPDFATSFYPDVQTALAFVALAFYGMSDGEPTPERSAKISVAMQLFAEFVGIPEAMIGGRLRGENGIGLLVFLTADARDLPEEQRHLVTVTLLPEGWFCDFKGPRMDKDEHTAMCSRNPNDSLRLIKSTIDQFAANPLPPPNKLN